MLAHLVHYLSAPIEIKNAFPSIQTVKSSPPPSASEALTLPVLGEGGLVRPQPQTL